MTPSNILRQQWTTTLDTLVFCLERSLEYFELFKEVYF